MTRLLWFGLLGLAFAPDALACGGLACDQGIPRDTAVFDAPTPRVDQTGERIVFAVDAEAHEVEVVVEVSYEGSVDDFAWIVPVPDVPDLFVAPRRLFDVLELGTAMRPSVRTFVEGTCAPRPPDPQADFDDIDADTDAETSLDTDTDGQDAGGVTIVASAQVGPYETVTLQADDADALLAWLSTQGFALPDAALPALDGYLHDGAYFVALRLAKDADVGDITPLGMRYRGDKAQIPLSLTRIAAKDDMRLKVWVLGPARAVPDNYLHVVPNLAQLNWFDGGQNWNDIIARAADEAGGQAFATDSALHARTRVEGLALGVYSESMASLPELRSAADAYAWLVAVRRQPIATLDPTVVDVLSDLLPVGRIASGATQLQLLNCPTCFEHELRAFPFDVDQATEVVATRIVEPGRHARDLLLNAAWVTRLTSSMSPHEMMVDPIFVFNRDLAPVPLERRASLVTLCAGDVFVEDAPRELRIDDGPTVPVPSLNWMFDRSMTWADFFGGIGGPKAARIEDTSDAGAPVLIADNSAAIRAAIAEATQGFADPSARTDGGCACAGAGGQPRGVLFGLLLGALGLAGRRRTA